MPNAILPALAIHPGVERWGIKTSVPAGAYTKNATWVGLAALMHLLDDPPGVRKNDRRYQAALKPGATEVFIVETPNPPFMTGKDSARWVAPGQAPIAPYAHGKLKHPARVSCVSQLFYDDSHVGDPPRGKGGQKATTLWEDPSGGLRGAAVSEEEVT